MASEGSCVWIETSVLLAALGKEKPSKKKGNDLDRAGNFSWTRCLVLSGDTTSAGTSLKVQVKDEESELSESVVEVNSGLGSGEICVANEWATNEANGSTDDVVPPNDLITLTHLHEPSVVFCLKRRYEKDFIYTNTGPILIALNPFKALPGLYDDDKMTEYWRVGEKVDVDVTLPPHVYANADSAFRQMMRGLELQISNPADPGAKSCDQSILVSGESGAGKTVTTKHIMKYLATLSQRKAEHAKRRRAPSPGRGEGTAPRRSVSSRRISRAASWKAGAQIEEQSE